jgi:hypothetical protein
MAIDHGPTEVGPKIKAYDLKKSSGSLVVADERLVPFNLHADWFDDEVVLAPRTSLTPGIPKIFGSSRNHLLQGEIFRRRAGVATLTLSEFVGDLPLRTIDLTTNGINSEEIFGAHHFEISNDGNRVLLFLSSADFLLFDSKSGRLIQKIRPSRKRFSSHRDSKIVRRLFSRNGAWIAFDGKIFSSIDLSPVSILMPKFSAGNAPVDSWFDQDDLILMTEEKIYRLSLIRGPENVLSTPIEILSR